MSRYAISRMSSPENWSDGPYDSREEAIEVGHDSYPDGFWICEIYPASHTDFLPKASDIIETMASQAYEEIGEAAQDWPDLPAKSNAEVDLDQALARWAAQHADSLKVTFWRCGDEERIDPVEAEERQ